MMLLQWCTLEPSERGGLAAIRFSAPVRVQTIRIFPTDAKPFLHCPDIIGRTEPETFFLDVYFNAQPVTNPTAKEKPKPSNALVPTSIAYSGGQRDYDVNMGPEYATRLMIVKGNFESVSMAIYGDTVADASSDPPSYEPRPLPSITPVPLAPTLDPANARDPTQLARQLLKLIPDAPELELAVRLVFCLKPSNDDWDLPDFPYLHPDLDEDTDDFNLDKAFRLTMRPVSDSIAPETVSRFAERVGRCITRQEDDSNQAHLVAGVLCHAACQYPLMAKELLNAIDMRKVFDQNSLENETTLLRLLSAAANADVARHLDTDWFLGLLSTISGDFNNEQEVRTAAKRLATRIRGWIQLGDAFSNTQGDFLAAAQMLKDVGSEEQSFGIWLESMLTHDDVVAALAENPVLSVTLPHMMSHRPTPAPSQDEFVAFVRAFVGVACVMAVYSWSDSLPDERCRARTLGILRLWQGTDGYGEIVNHFLLLRQMTFRLECMTDNDSPTQSGVDAEHILVELARNPRAILRPNLVKCILNIPSSTLYITDDERTSMRQAAYVVDDGFGGAVDELTRPLERPPTFGSLRTLRVALAYIERELDDDEESRVLDDFWEDAHCSLTTCLCDLLAPVVEDIRSHFSLLQPPPRMGQDVIAQLFWTADDILRLLLRIVPAYPIPSRLIRTLATNAADVFACADAADMLYFESSQPFLAAQDASQSCIDIVRALMAQDAASSGGKHGAQVVLRVLLEQGLQSDGLDPTHHLLQVFCLLNYLLPTQDCTRGQRTLWVQHVIPTLLHELSTFCHALDTENKVHFVTRLVELDQGSIGVGEWLLLEELNHVSQAVTSLQDEGLPIPKRRVAESQVSLFFRFFADTLKGPSTSWVIEGLVDADEASHLLASTILTLLDLDSAPLRHLGEVAETIAAHYDVFDNELRYALLVALWRSLQTPGLTSSRVERRFGQSITILPTITPSYLDPLRLTAEVGRLVVALTDSPVSLEGETSHSLVSLLEWINKTSTTVPRMAEMHTLSSDQFNSLRDRLSSQMSADWTDRLDAVSSALVFGGSTSAPQPTTTDLPDTVQLSIHDIEDLLREHTPAPTTPPRRALNQDVFGLVTISPPTLLRSPAVTGLTKMYLNNDFRQLRQTSARANTSRLPSRHVDEFENASQSSPTLDPVISGGVNVRPPGTVPGAGMGTGGVNANLAGKTYPTVPDPGTFPQLGPAFSPM